MEGEIGEGCVGQKPDNADMGARTVQSVCTVSADVVACNEAVFVLSDPTYAPLRPRVAAMNP